MREFLANIASNSTVADNVELLRFLLFVANITSQSDTSGTVRFTVTRELSTDIRSNSTTGAAKLAVLRELLADVSSGSEADDFVNLIIPGATFEIPIDRIMKLLSRESVVSDAPANRTIVSKSKRVLH